MLLDEVLNARPLGEAVGHPVGFEAEGLVSEAPGMPSGQSTP